MFSYMFQKKLSRKSKKSFRKTKKLNCSPFVAGKTPVKTSCLTEDVLYKIKSDYNKNHNDNPIRYTDPTKIWEELHNRLTTCSKEDCWLSQIKDESMRKKIKDEIYAPSQPPEWKKNPNEWLSNFDILNVLKQYEKTYSNFKFIGPSFIDFDDPLDETCVSEELCNFKLEEYVKNKITKIGVIFNLDKHDQSGSHWVSLFIDIESRFIFYLDSAGSPIPTEINNLVKRVQKQARTLGFKIRFYENYPLEHQMGNTECGMYSLFFIITMLTGKTEDKDLKPAKKRIRFFKEERIPDKYVEQLRNKYFNSA